MSVAVPADIDSWIGKSVDPSREAELQNCIDYAASWVAQQAGIRSIEKEATAVTVTLDGDRAEGVGRSDLWLPRDMRPLWHSGSDLVTVSENGVALTVAAGYSASADVLIKDANAFEMAMLYRWGTWARFKQNVTVTAKCGWDTSIGATVLKLPLNVKRLVMEVAWLMFNAPGWIGKQHVSKAGVAVSLEKDLSDQATDTLENLTGL